MVLTQFENFHLALLASEAVPGINDLAILLAKAMEHPWVKGKRRPTGSSCEQPAVGGVHPLSQATQVES